MTFKSKQRSQWDTADSGGFRKGRAELIYESLGADYFRHSYLQNRNFLSCCLCVSLSSVFTSKLLNSSCFSLECLK